MEKSHGVATQGSGLGSPHGGSNRPSSSLWQALGLVGQLGFTIAIPLVVFALVGRMLDRHFGTSPWLFLAGVGLAIAATTLLLIRKFSQLLRDITNPR